jgi:hypothetical protein
MAAPAHPLKLCQPMYIKPTHATLPNIDLIKSRANQAVCCLRPCSGLSLKVCCGHMEVRRTPVLPEPRYFQHKTCQLLPLTLATYTAQTPSLRVPNLLRNSITPHSTSPAVYILNPTRSPSDSHERLPKWPGQNTRRHYSLSHSTYRYMNTENQHVSRAT